MGLLKHICLPNQRVTGNHSFGGAGLISTASAQEGEQVIRIGKSARIGGRAMLLPKAPAGKRSGFRAETVAQRNLDSSTVGNPATLVARRVPSTDGYPPSAANYGGGAP